MGFHDSQLHRQHEQFTAPDMLAMPFARYEDRRAAQEEAFMRWCDERGALPTSTIHAARDARPGHPYSAASIERYRGSAA